MLRMFRGDGVRIFGTSSTATFDERDQQTSHGGENRRGNYLKNGNAVILNFFLWSRTLYA